MIEQLKEIFLGYFESLKLLLPSLILALIVLLFFVLLGRLFYKTFKRMLVSKADDPLALDFVGRVIKWFFILIGLIVALHLMGFSGIANSVLTGAGISALILGFAFKDIFENFLSGILLAFNRPFSMGNIIEVDGFKGTVKGLNLRTTHIRNIEGKDFFIPNAVIVKSVLINYTKDGFLRLDFDIGMDVSSDMGKVKTLILEYLTTVPEVLKSPAPNVLTINVGNYTIDIKVLFWVDVLKDKHTPASFLGNTVKSKIINETIDLLLEHNFNIPNPILEHKMYEPDKAIKIKVDQDN